MHLTPCRFAIASLVLALIAGLLYLPGLPGDWLFDDYPNIVNNSAVHLQQFSFSAIIDLLSTPQPSGNLRSLPTLTFALDYWRAGGSDPASFKITNIVIHAITAFALAWFFRKLLRMAGVTAKQAGWLALALAFAWAAHPLLVSSALYVVQRLQTLGTLFLLLALLAYLQARQAQIDGESSRSGWLLFGLCWVLALNCKEDSTLLPAYTLALELTVLRFAAADAELARRLQRGYSVACVLGLLVYLIFVIPHFWRWDAYDGRDFSTLERLLTQPRMLCMYLWQIIAPLPSHMPFYYDWVQPSRSLLQPWTTLPAIMLVSGLIAVGWLQRQRRPLLALGIFLFFAAHFITSNVIGLELAFEHRNHFALIGAVLSVGCVLAELAQRLRLTATTQTGLCVSLLLAVACATLLRAQSWSSPILLAEAGTIAAPHSPRAWIDLCSARFEAGGGVAAASHNPQLDTAIEACRSGAAADPQSLNNLAKMIVLKTLRGDLDAQDWAAFQQRLERVRMSWDNARAPLIFTYYAGLGVALDQDQVLQSLATLTQRTPLKPTTLARIGLAVMTDLQRPDLARDYFIQAVEASPPSGDFAWQLGAELRSQGHAELASEIEALALQRQRAAVNQTGK